jgi:hypothetical protein
MVNAQNERAHSNGNAQNKRSFELTIDGKTYQVQILRHPDSERPAVIAVDGNVFNVKKSANGVKINDESFVASLAADLSIVGGKLYETEWKVE